MVQFRTLPLLGDTIASTKATKALKFLRSSIISLSSCSVDNIQRCLSTLYRSFWPTIRLAIGQSRRQQIKEELGPTRKHLKALLPLTNMSISGCTGVTVGDPRNIWCSTVWAIQVQMLIGPKVTLHPMKPARTQFKQLPKKNMKTFCETLWKPELFDFFKSWAFLYKAGYFPLEMVILFNPGDFLQPR